MSKRIWFLFCFCLLVVTGCQTQEERGPTTITLLTHDSFEMNADLLAQFSAETGHTVEIIKLGDAGQLLNQAILSKDTPLGDVLYGVDNSFLTRALDEQIFVPYNSPILAQIAPELQLDPTHRALPVNFGDVCLNYDMEWFRQRQLTPPQRLPDLIDPAYKGLLVVENPATSSPGMAFLMATVSQFGEDGYLPFWQGLKANEVRIESGWSEAYYTAFTLYGGDRPIVVSYATSPAAELHFAESPIETPPTASVNTAGSCFRQIEFVGILKGTPKQLAAQQWVDFMLSKEFQEGIPLSLFVYPANQSAEWPDLFHQHAPFPQQPATLSPQQISAGRETWLEAWNSLMRQE